MAMTETRQTDTLAEVRALTRIETRDQRQRATALLAGVRALCKARVAFWKAVKAPVSGALDALREQERAETVPLIEADAKLVQLLRRFDEEETARERERLALARATAEAERAARVAALVEAAVDAPLPQATALVAQATALEQRPVVVEAAPAPVVPSDVGARQVWTATIEDARTLVLACAARALLDEASDPTVQAFLRRYAPEGVTVSLTMVTPVASEVQKMAKAFGKTARMPGVAVTARTDYASKPQRAKNPGEAPESAV
jgi:hypothetical protein